MPKGRRGGRNNGGGAGGGNLSDEFNQRPALSDIGKYIKNQVGVDISKYQDSFTRRFDTVDHETVYIKEMPTNERARLFEMQAKYGDIKYICEDIGTWGVQIVTGKAKDSYVKAMREMYGKRWHPKTSWR